MMLLLVCLYGDGQNRPSLMLRHSFDFILNLQDGSWGCSMAAILNDFESLLRGNHQMTNIFWNAVHINFYSGQKFFYT